MNIWLPVLGALFYGLSYSLVGGPLRNVTPIWIVLFYNGFSFFALIAWILLVGDKQILVDPKAGTVPWGWMIADGVVCVLAGLITVKSIHLLSASLTAFVEVCYPVFTILFCWLLFKEQIEFKSFILGGGLIAAGIYIINKG